MSDLPARVALRDGLQKRLLEAAELAQRIVGHELPSRLLKAGPRTRLAV
ncbi:hypothetical protein AB0H57_08515 [Micromonospora sp. NPDC050686]